MIASLYKRRGRFSTSKLWRQVACAVATYVVILQAKTIAPEMLLVYLVCVGGIEAAQRIMAAKLPSQGVPQNESS